MRGGDGGRGHASPPSRLLALRLSPAQARASSVPPPMLSLQRIALLCAEVFACSCIRRDGPPAAGPEGRAGPALVTVSPAERHQTLEGFGASIAFEIGRAVGDPPHGLYKALFPDLGLDIIRLRNRYQRSEPGDADLAQEVEILRRATEALGHRPKVMLSSWSPPASLKANGAERCKGNDDCTLKKESGQFVYAKFGEYWLDSMKHYATLGIEPDYI